MQQSLAKTDRRDQNGVQNLSQSPHTHLLFHKAGKQPLCVCDHSPDRNSGKRDPNTRQQAVRAGLGPGPPDVT